MRLLILLAIAAIGCGSTPDPAADQAPSPAAAGSGSAGSGSAGTGSAGTGSAGSGDGSGRRAGPGRPNLPRECDDYRATVERLAQCGDAIPPEMRKQLGAAIDRAWDAGAPGARSKQADAELAKICQSAAENIRAAASTACGW